jgi:hypothetical protein
MLRVDGGTDEQDSRLDAVKPGVILTFSTPVITMTDQTMSTNSAAKNKTQRGTPPEA